MRRVMVTVACLTAVAAWSGAVYAGDCAGCAVIKKDGQGYCDHCGSGKIYGLKVASRKLYDALAGEEGKIDDLKKSPCSGCKTAAAKSGDCAHCKVFVANDRIYHSGTARALARGERVDAHGLECKRCAYAAGKSGSCKACDKHFAADRSYKTASFHEAALKAYETVKQAVRDASHCENCAVARVADGTCKDCKVAFKNGKPVS